MNQTTLEPYATLGVPRGATERQVREAYRRLAKRHHPDLDPTHESGDRMRRINQAWEILSSPTRRAQYDAESRHTGPAIAGHWAAPARRSSPQWSVDRTSPPPASTSEIDDGGHAWPFVLVAIAFGVILVVAVFAGFVPVPFFGIALVVLARGFLGRFGDGR